VSCPELTEVTLSERRDGQIVADTGSIVVHSVEVERP